MSSCVCKYMGEANCDIHRGDAGMRSASYAAATATSDATLVPVYLFRRVISKLHAHSRGFESIDMPGCFDYLDQDKVTKEQLIQFYHDLREILP